MNEIRKKYAKQLCDLSCEAIYQRGVVRNEVQADRLYGAINTIEELMQDLAMARAASRAACAELARIYEERDHLNEAVARIAKERDELKARYCEPTEGGDCCGEEAVCGNAGGAGEEAGACDGTSGC